MTRFECPRCRYVSEAVVSPGDSVACPKCGLLVAMSSPADVAPSATAVQRPRVADLTAARFVTVVDSGDNRQSKSSDKWFANSFSVSFGTTAGCLVALILVPATLFGAANFVAFVKNRIVRLQSNQLEKESIELARTRYAAVVLRTLRAYGGFEPDVIAAYPPLTCKESQSPRCDKELAGRCVRADGKTSDFRIGIKETRVKVKTSTTSRVEPVFVEIDGTQVWQEM